MLDLFNMISSFVFKVIDNAFPMLLFFVALVCLFVLWQIAKEEFKFHDAEKIQGKILDRGKLIKGRGENSVDGYRPIIEYTLNGEKLTFLSNLITPDLVNGQDVEIDVTKDGEVRKASSSHMMILFGVLMMFVFCIGFLIHDLMN